MKISDLAMTSCEGAASGLEISPAAPRYCDPQIAAALIDRTLERRLSRRDQPPIGA